MSPAIELVENSLSHPVPAPGPLFVLSVWRSGSSLLYVLLNQHSKIALLYEADLPLLQVYLWGRLRKGGWREKWEFWNQALSRHGIELETLPDQVPDVWEATRIAYQSVASRKQATIWGEKTPHWYHRPLRLAEKFPDARFIFLWRDLHAVIGSMARAAATHRFFRRPSLARKALLGNERLKEACDALRAQGRPVHEVNYEDLISNTRECMQQICQFLDIPFEPQITSLAGGDRSAISEAGSQHHAMVQGDRIVNHRVQNDVLSPARGAKIDRYICRWKRRHGGKWPKYPMEVPAETRPPRLGELWFDRITNQAVFCWDKAVNLAYALMPAALGRLWRARRQQALASQVVGSKQEVTE